MAIQNIKDLLKMAEDMNIEHDYQNIYDFVEDIEYYTNYADIYNMRYNENNRVSKKEIVYYNFDGRRYISLSVMYMDKVPMAVLQRAGREGDDHKNLLVFDFNEFKKSVDYIESLCDKEEEDKFSGLNIVDLDYCEEDLFKFYGYNVNAFNYPNFETDYHDLISVQSNIGDVVTAQVYNRQDFHNYIIGNELREEEVVIVSKNPTCPFYYITGYLKNLKHKSDSNACKELVPLLENEVLEDNNKVYVRLNCKLKQITRG